jgi:hypothetical protein
MNKKKLMFATLLIIGAACAAKATKARDFIGYIYSGGAYVQVYVPFDCPYTGYGCTYTNWNGTSFQVYLQSGLLFYPVRP